MKKRHSRREIMEKLAKIDELVMDKGKTLPEAIKLMDIDQPTYSRWQNRYAQQQPAPQQYVPSPQAQRRSARPESEQDYIAQLEARNADLEKIVADQTIELRHIRGGEHHPQYVPLNNRPNQGQHEIDRFGNTQH